MNKHIKVQNFEKVKQADKILREEIIRTTQATGDSKSRGDDKRSLTLVFALQAVVAAHTGGASRFPKIVPAKRI